MKLEPKEEGMRWLLQARQDEVQKTWISIAK